MVTNHPNPPKMVGAALKIGVEFSWNLKFKNFTSYVEVSWNLTP
jgi:hypothetical protein